MPTVTLHAGTERRSRASRTTSSATSDAEPVLLIAGCGQPAFAWQVGVGPALAAAGYRVDHVRQPGGRAVVVAARAVHRRRDGRRRARAARPSGDPDRAHRRSFDGRVDRGDAHGPSPRAGARRGVPRQLQRRRLRGRRRSRPSSAICAALDYELPPLFYATETMRYLPNQDLQDDATVDTWLMFIGDHEPWPNPGRLGQYEACLAWSTDPEHGAALAGDRRALPRHGVRARRRLAAGCGRGRRPRSSRMRATSRFPTRATSHRSRTPMPSRRRWSSSSARREWNRSP